MSIHLTKINIILLGSYRQTINTIFDNQNINTKYEEKLEWRNFSFSYSNHSRVQLASSLVSVFLLLNNFSSSSYIWFDCNREWWMKVENIFLKWTREIISIFNVIEWDKKCKIKWRLKRASELLQWVYNFLMIFSIVHCISLSFVLTLGKNKISIFLLFSICTTNEE